MIDCLIFSKDRACQLHFLLDSLAKNAPDFFDSIGVLYKATTPEFEEAYNLLQAEGHDVYWFQQTEPFASSTEYFKVNVLDIMGCSDAEYFSFLVDDDIIYRELPVDSYFVEHMMDEMDLFCFSLRLGTNTKYEGVQTKQQASGPAELGIYDEKAIFWDAGKIRHHGSFGYPFSVDGHIMRTHEIIRILKTYDFDTPNGLEGNYRETPEEQWMGAFVDSVLVNTPLNLVGSSQNWIGEKYSVDLETLNEKYLKGFRPDLKSMDFSDIIGCHMELELKFK